MKVIIAPDKFKSSLSAREFCQVIDERIGLRISDVELVSLPMSDGGDGFCEVLHHYGGLNWCEEEVLDPLFRPVKAKFLVDAAYSAAYIEMARSSGLTLLSPGERSALNTTSYGLGQLILAALGKGVRTIYIGLGGSATNDAGLGMASALGYRFLDINKREVQPIGKSLSELHHIVKSELSLLNEARFIVLSDVANPLHGPEGAAFQYAEQKGASKKDIPFLDEGLKHLEQKVKQGLNTAGQPRAGDGAAGGLGAACRWFLNAELHSGAEFILNRSGFFRELEDADLVITGEGRFDQQSMMGKLPGLLQRICRERMVEIALIAGEIDSKTKTDPLFFRAISLSEMAGNKEKAIQNVTDYLVEAGLDIIESYKNKLWTH